MESHLVACCRRAFLYSAYSPLLFRNKVVETSQKTQESFSNYSSNVLIIAISCLLLRIGNLFIFDTYSLKWFLFATHVRLDSLMFGVFLSYLWHFHSLESRMHNIRTSLLLALGVVFLSPAFIFPREQYLLISVFGVILFYLGSGLLLLAALRFRQSESQFFKLCGALGAASYSIYLWHLAWQDWGWSAAKRITGLDSYLYYFFFYLIGSLIFGWLMSKMIEWPVLRLRDRFFPKTQLSNAERSR